MRHLVVAATVLLVVTGAAAGNAPPLSPALGDHLAEGPAPFWVVLREQADLAAIEAIPDPVVRRSQMVAALKMTARDSQTALRAELEARDVPVRSFWIVNALLVEGDADLAEELLRRTDVARLLPDSRYRSDLPRPQQPDVQAQEVAVVEWNVERVGATAVWQNEGVRGEGIVVAIADTGIAWDHPALIAQERVFAESTVQHTYFPVLLGGSTTAATSTSDVAPQNAHFTEFGTPDCLQPFTICNLQSAIFNVHRNHDYAWHDAIADTSAPLDDTGHGTHVIGTALGDDGAGNQIGVAPGAEWIGCRNMDHGVGTPSRYLECFEWFLAPTRIDGSEPRPELAPHIVSNSWTCPPSEGCDDDEALELLRAGIERLRDAGILVVVAAGNSGSACKTVYDAPALYDESLTVGASTQSDTLASFSSRGPVTRDGSYRLKPDLVAPGAGVRSSYPPDSYLTLNGTSMATPAVSGVAALLWSAVPHLQGDVELTERILRESAEAKIDTTCGAPDADGHPNNAWGWGIVDAVAAIELAKTCPTNGDWDGDGAIAREDVDRVAAYVGQTVTPETAVFDLNGDGTIGVADVEAVSAWVGQTCQWSIE